MKFKKLIVASNNDGKIKEIKHILGGSFEQIISLKEAKIDIDVEENGSTFFENALIKAKAIYELTGQAALSDDSGLVVEALNGAPGIFSARYAGENKSADDNNCLLLKNMQNIQNRNAKFVACIVLYFGNDNYIYAHGETQGTILDKKVGSEGFGYDPIFFSTELNKSFAQANLDEKNKVSHRAKALNALLKKLQS